jgi:hypothetical protein
MRYYIQGLNKGKEPIANSGDAKHPFTVPIREQISGDEPRLPGMKPPKQCGGANADCPPDFPGCGKSKGGEDEGSGEKTESEGAQKEGEGENAEEASRSKKFKRFWLGAGLSIEWMHMRGGNNVCRLNPPAGSGQPTSGTPGYPYNTLNYYCTNLDGSDFPSHQDLGVQNNSLQPGTSGNVADQVPLGNVRVFASLDYALNERMLVGLRLGGVFNAYPGQAAINQGRASGLGALYAEVRGTYLFGKDPLVRGFAPMGFVGGGLSEFDAHTSDKVGLFNYMNTALQVRTVNIWRTDGPGFLMLGAGARWAVSNVFALTAAARLNIALGGNGAIPTFGPEFGVQYGF